MSDPSERYVNAHDHLCFYRDWDRESKEIEERGIVTMACSLNVEDYEMICLAAAKSPSIKKGFGIHPWKVEAETSTEGLEYYIRDCDFIGEIGLDFFWAERKELYDKQREIFRYFLRKAKEHQKPVNIHTKGAEAEVLECLKEIRPKSVIIHWYSGPLELVEEYLKLGCLFTIGSDTGVSTLTDELIHRIPPDQMLTETDGPTSLEWVRGIYADADLIPRIVRYIAKLQKVDERTIRQRIWKNFENMWEDAGGRQKDF